MKTIGTPLKSWISTKSTTYTDITGTSREIPAGSWWLKTQITDPTAIKMIDEGKLTAYSLTTANQIYADKIVNLLNGQSQSNKSQTKELQDLATKSRTLIKDIDNPVGFTVSLTNFPCVSNAVFAKQCLFESQTNNKNNKNEDDIMTEDIKTTKYTIDDIKSLFNLFSKKNEKTEKEELVSIKADSTTQSKEETTTTTSKDESKSNSNYATKEDITKINNRLDELASKIEKLQGNKKESNNSEEKQKETTNSSNKNKETTANKTNTKLSKEIPHNHDGINNQSYKNNINPEAHLMESLGRDQYGISKFKTNKKIITTKE